MKRFFAFAILSLIFFGAKAQNTPYPYIGAQVFIEPGQSKEQITKYFKILKDSNMPVCRIRMFESHMRRDDGWDFSLYDAAFDAAANNGVKIFATLFPENTEAGVAGIRFPDSEKQMDRIAEYIEAIVKHFGPKPAMYVWVLQNEPGWGANARTSEATALSRKTFAQWKSNQSKPAYENGYMKARLDELKFLTYYTTWYLRWVSEQINRWDNPRHYHHINPHGVFNTLPEYDFVEYQSFLGSLGASMHASWHFDLFSRDKYDLAVAITCDIIRQGAGKTPFWITELQGGSATYSGKVSLCPTREEIAQWLWVGIGSGAEGAIFWSLNQRGSDKEAGEWGMLDFTEEPSDRLKMASEVSSAVLANKTFFAESSPLIALVTLIYNRESFWVMRLKDPGNRAAFPARSMSAPVLSLISAYQSFALYGISPQVEAMETFDWNGEAKGRIAVICNMVSIPSQYWAKIDSFVKRGGKLIVMGMSGYFDENMHSVMLTGFPLSKCFGGSVTEFKVESDIFNVSLTKPAIKLPSNMWKGIIKPTTGEVVGVDKDGVLALSNKYGDGEVLWIPSMVEIGSWFGDNYPLSYLLRSQTACITDKVAFRFIAPMPGVLMRTLRSGNSYMTIIVNKRTSTALVELITPANLKPTTVFGKGVIDGNMLFIEPEQTQVIIWR